MRVPSVLSLRAGLVIRFGMNMTQSCHDKLWDDSHPAGRWLTTQSELSGLFSSQLGLGLHASVRLDMGC